MCVVEEPRKKSRFHGAPLSSFFSVEKTFFLTRLISLLSSIQGSLLPQEAAKKSADKQRAKKMARTPGYLSSKKQQTPTLVLWWSLLNRRTYRVGMIPYSSALKIVKNIDLNFSYKNCNLRASFTVIHLNFNAKNLLQRWKMDLFIKYFLVLYKYYYAKILTESKKIVIFQSNS